MLWNKSGFPELIVFCFVTNQFVKLNSNQICSLGGLFWKKLDQGLFALQFGFRSLGTSVLLCDVHDFHLICDMFFVLTLHVSTSTGHVL